MSDSDDSEGSYTVSTRMSASGEDIQIRKRKRPRYPSTDLKNQTIDNRVNNIENLLSQLLQGEIPTDLSGVLSKKAKVTSEQTPSGISKCLPSKNNRSQISRRTRSLDGNKKGRDIQAGGWQCQLCEMTYSTNGNLVRHYKSNHGETPGPIHQKKISEKSSNESASTSKGHHLTEKDIQYDCKLCEALFTSVKGRNIHYTGTHKVENEKLLFFPDGSALVESSLSYHVSVKPDWLKAAAKRNTSSGFCKLCQVDMNIDELKWHYESKHKVIQTSKVKPIICLNNSDVKIVAEPYKCNECSRTFDDVSRLKVHMSAHSDVIYCKFCKVNIERNVYNNHIKNEHANMYYKKIGITGKRVLRKPHNVRTNKTNMMKKTGQSFLLKLKCRCCPRRFISLVAVREHRRAVHKKTETSGKKTREEVPKCNNNDMAKVVEKQKEQDANSILISAPAIMMLLCDACDLATTSYDEAVAHSQDHILNNVNTKTAHCEQCNLKFAADYETHMQLHSIRDDIDIDSFRCVTYDFRLLLTDKWLDMFDYLPKFKIKIIESASVYFSTRCIRFKLHSGRKDASAPFTLFQCVTCNKFVDPFSIVSHVKEQNCSNLLNSYPCELCQRQFYTETARIQHDLTHKVPNANSKYRTVLFNDKNDIVINKSLLEAAEKGVHAQEENTGNSGEKNRPKNVEVKVPDRATNETKKVVNDAQNVTVEENNISSENEIPNIHKAIEEKVATVYKCQCELCFDRLNCLFKHLEICIMRNTLENETVKCKCGLVFDRHNYSFHCKVHCNGFTTIHVKEVIVRAERKIDIRGMVQPKFNDNSPSLEVGSEIERINKENSENPNTPMDLQNQDNRKQPTLSREVGRETDANKNTENINQPMHLQNQQCILENNNESPTPANIQNHEQSINRDGMKRVILMYNYLRDALNLVGSINVAPPQETMEVTEGNESNTKHDDVQMCSNNSQITEENKSLVATTMEVELKQAEDRRKSGIGNPGERHVTPEKPQVSNLALVENKSTKHQEKQENYARQVIDNRNTKKYVRDSIRNVAESPRYSTSNISQRYNLGDLTKNKTEDTIKRVKETNEPKKDDEIDEYDKEELLKEPDYTSCSAMTPMIESLLTDDED